jgi:hypothetical protein
MRRCVELALNARCRNCRSRIDGGETSTDGCAAHRNFRGGYMPLYKEYGVLASGLSLAERGRPDAYVPFASVFTWNDGCFRLTRQFTWDDLEQPTAEAAKITADALVRRAIDCGDVA